MNSTFTINLLFHFTYCFTIDLLFDFILNVAACGDTLAHCGDTFACGDTLAQRVSRVVTHLLTQQTRDK